MVRQDKDKEDAHDSGRALVAPVEEVMVYCMHKVNETGEFLVAVTEEALQDVR